MPHICMDEVMAFMMAMPFIGMFIRLYRARAHAFAKRMMERVWRMF